MKRKSIRRAAAALDRKSPRALHEQLSDLLRVELVSSPRSDEAIPTEKQIGQTYGLSRVTVRRAMQTLVEQGVLIRRQGKGTFLARSKPSVVYEIDRFGPFMAAFHTSQQKVSVNVLDFAWINGDEVPQELGSEQSALRYVRLYATDGVPHALLEIMLPARVGEKVSRADAAAMGIYQILQERLGLRPVSASFNISSELPNPALVRALRVSPTTPLLVLERISYDANGVAIERTVHHLLPDVYKLKANAKAPAELRSSSARIGG